MLRTVLFRLIVVLLLVVGVMPLFTADVAAYTYTGSSFSVNHTSTDITQIPEYWINKAKTDLHIGYGRQSHGAQLTCGMGYNDPGGWTGLVAFANGGGKGLSLPEDIFAWGNGDTGGTQLDMEESVGGWLQGTCGTVLADGSPEFVPETIEYLNDPSHEDVNIIIWSWCSELQISIQATDNVTVFYLEPMNQLEIDYPDVTFVYMTAHASKSPLDGDPAGYYNRTIAGNDIIRQYCLDNDKILYDFFDIESWDPDGDNFPYADTSCDYYESPDDWSPTGNWATEWQDTHDEGLPNGEVGGDWYDVQPHLPQVSNLHTEPLNCNLKAYAAWWLWARLAGWDGTAVTDTEAPSVTVNAPNGGEKFKKGCDYNITWSATDDVGVTSCNISYSTNNGASYTDIATGEANDGTYIWTVPDNPSTTCLVRVAASDAAGNWGEGTSDATFEICSSLPGDANDDGWVTALDITKTEQIILEVDSPTEDADANEDGDFNILDITKIEQIITGP